jgi:hypothetical protein
VPVLNFQEHHRAAEAAATSAAQAGSSESPAVLVRGRFPAGGLTMAQVLDCLLLFAPFLALLLIWHGFFAKPHYPRREQHRDPYCPRFDPNNSGMGGGGIGDAGGGGDGGS